MKSHDFNPPQLLELIAEVLDGNLDDERRTELNDILRASPEARCFYREHMELHARLHLDYTSAEVTEFLPGAPARHKPSSRIHFRVIAFAAAACIALLAVLVWPRQPDASNFVTLESSSGARWDSSDLATQKGTRLGKGTLRLAEGIVNLRFDSGAQISLEAPVELTLVNAMNCTLGSGIVVANVSNTAKGFRITTPAAQVVDYGTRFSVKVNPSSGETQTHVYEGHVKVEHLSSGEVVALKAGQMNSADLIKMGEPRTWDGEALWPTPSKSATEEPEWTILKTSKDAFIGKAKDGGVLVPHSKTLLLVKRSKKSNGGRADRIAYLGFDLAGVDPVSIDDAELKLHFVPTGLGLASDVPDATFHVYGLLTDESWEESTLKIGNAPATTGGIKLAKDKIQDVGTFLVEQGVQSGQFGIRGEKLVAFLRERAGKKVTLIVVRGTEETRITGLVHGFASRRHPTLPAPTLAFGRKAVAE